ncbi:hypothetical protein [Bradymonas sediminis]|uniref:Uncharacterized protein n=1 Tax=Bradymonas sediminis TaxID=1548548 RepID=A0A2Z4FQI9_9DELT|nr:hypothetical protein [Bradymonas sediminis]AWV91152.1 hypothetical protein DN745_18195 [Bradymonas sediminis]TDP73711.1 hypothetical protein DFR33_10543 [Bradymonas sediminis]
MRDFQKYLKSISSLSVLIAGLLVAQTAFAQEFSRGVRPSGMGQAYTGVAEGTSAMYFNPGGVASRMMYQAEGVYEYTPTGSVLNASIIDSKTNPDVAAGVAYSYHFGNADHSGLSGHDIRLAIAIPALPEQISIGVGGRYMIVKQDVPDAETVELINGFTLDAGALFRVSDMIQIGVAGRNLLDVCQKDNLCSTVAPTTVAGGLSIADGQSFVVAIDGGADLTSDPNAVHPFFQGGVEYFAGGVVPMRLGYQRLQVNERNMLTAGLGLRLKSAGIDTGFRMDLSDTDYFFVNASVSLFF